MMIHSYIRYMLGTAATLRSEAERDRRRFGTNYDYGDPKICTAHLIEYATEAWLNERLDVRQAMAETGKTDRWLRDSPRSTGDGRNRRWRRSDLLDIHVVAQIGMDPKEAEAVLTEMPAPVPVAPPSDIDVAVLDAAAHLDAA